MDTAKRVAPPITFVYYFGLQNLRRHIETALFTILVPQVSMNFYSWEVGLGHFLNKTKNVYFYWTH